MPVIKDYKRFYAVKGRSLRINFCLGERFNELPVDILKSMRDYLTDKSDGFGSNRKRWNMVMKHDASDLFLHEILTMCDTIGCSMEQLMNKDVSLLPIYMVKRKKEEKELAKKYELTND